MTPTTGAASLRRMRLFCSSTDTDVWLDLSGHLTALDVTGGDVATDYVHIMDYGKAIVRRFKREPLDVAARIVYSESASEAPMQIDLAALKRAGTAIRLAWAPKGVAVGNFAFLTGDAYLYAVGLPGGEVGDGAPVVTEFRVKCSALDRITISSTDWPGDLPEQFYGLLTEAGEYLTTEAAENLLQEF